MKNTKRATGIASVGVMAALILDNQTVLQGAREGIDLCIRTVIPSLFPFIFLTTFLLCALSPSNRGFGRLLCSLFCMPPESASVLLSGLLGGYPVGAKCIGQAVASGRMSASDGKRMIIYCNAAGPAFLLGMLAPIFSSKWVLLLIWVIHILGAVCTAWVLREPSSPIQTLPSGNTLTLVEALRQSLRSICEICGWILLMRIVILLLDKWVLWWIPAHLRLLIVGLLELSNGCLSLAAVEQEGVRLLFCVLFLSFGGLCVALQTYSCAPKVDCKLYLPGKMLQAGISTFLAYPVQMLLYSGRDWAKLAVWFLGAITFGAVFLFFRTKKQKNGGIFGFVDV